MPDRGVVMKLAKFRYIGPDPTAARIVIVKKTGPAFIKLNRDDGNYTLLQLMRDRRAPRG